MGDEELRVQCHICGNDHAVNIGGSWVCAECGTQSQGVLDEQQEWAQVNARDLRSGLVRKRNKVVDKEARAKAQSRNAERPLGVAPAAEAYAQALQLLLMAQCKEIKRHLGASEDLLPVARVIWLALVKSTGVLGAEVRDEHTQILQEGPGDSDEDDGEQKARKRLHPETRAARRHGRALVRALKSVLPVPSTLAVAFLAVTWLRLPLTAQDLVSGCVDGIVPWAGLAAISHEGKVPIENLPRGCLTLTRTPSVTRVLATAALIAERLGFQVPPTNAQALAERYASALGLPAEVGIAAARALLLHAPKGLALDAGGWAADGLTPHGHVMAGIVFALKVLYEEIGGEAQSSAHVSGPKLPSVVLQVPAPKLQLLRNKGHANLRNPKTGRFFPRGSSEALAALAALEAEAIDDESEEGGEEDDGDAGAGDSGDAGSRGLGDSTGQAGAGDLHIGPRAGSAPAAPTGGWVSWVAKTQTQAQQRSLKPSAALSDDATADPYKLTRYGPEGFLSSLSKGPLASCEGLSRATELRRSLSDCAEAAGRLLAPPATLRVVARVADGKKLQAQLATAAAAFADKTRKGRRKRAAGAAAEGLACDGGAFAEQSYGIWNTLELAPPLYQAVAKVCAQHVWATPESLHRAVTAIERRAAALEAAASLELLSAGYGQEGASGARFNEGSAAAAAAEGGTPAGSPQLPASATRRQEEESPAADMDAWKGGASGQRGSGSAKRKKPRAGAS